MKEKNIASGIHVNILYCCLSQLSNKVQEMDTTEDEEIIDSIITK